jgi:hypothetical protein
VSSDGNSASASDCGICSAAANGTTETDSKKINNERVFIPDLYPQISQIAADLF